jgi:hypothetical protein
MRSGMPIYELGEALCAFAASKITDAERSHIVPGALPRALTDGCDAVLPTFLSYNLVTERDVHQVYSAGDVCGHALFVTRGPCGGINSVRLSQTAASKRREANAPSIYANPLGTQPDLVACSAVVGERQGEYGA